MLISKVKQILLLFTKELKNNDISYALGGSLLLHLEGITTTVQDIDLLVDINDHDKLQKVLKKYKFDYIKANPKYRTEHFYTITINDIDIDIMLGFKVQTEKGLYEFPFKIEKKIRINNQTINLSSIQEWLQAYKAMNRVDKIELITNHSEFKIETERLLIRKVCYEDKMSMYKYMSDKETLYYERSEPFTLETMDKLLSDIVPTGSFYSVKIKETAIHIGHIYFGINTPRDFKEFNIGYIFNKDFHNKGYCSEASRAIIDYGFKHFNIHRVTAKCNPDNIASWKVMEKIGLLKEGHLKERVCFKKDELGNPIWWDEYIYGITKINWLKKSV